jgi:hypothetical protein
MVAILWMDDLSHHDKVTEILQQMLNITDNMAWQKHPRDYVWLTKSSASMDKISTHNPMNKLYECTDIDYTRARMLTVKTATTNEKYIILINDGAVVTELNVH